MKKHFVRRNGVLSRTIFFKNLFFILLLLHLTGCGFQGRKYTTGHYWDGRNEIEYEKQSAKQSESESEKQKEKEKENEELNGNEAELGNIEQSATIQPLLMSIDSIPPPVLGTMPKVKTEIPNEEEIPEELKKAHTTVGIATGILGFLTLANLISVIAQATTAGVGAVSIFFISIVAMLIALIVNIVLLGILKAKINRYNPNAKQESWYKKTRIIKGFAIGLNYLSGILILFYAAFVLLIALLFGFI